MPNVQLLHEYIRLVLSDDVKEMVRGLIAMRKLSIEHNRKDTIQTILDSKAVGKLLRLAQLESSPLIQNEAIWLLCNLSSSSSNQTEVLVRRGIIPVVFAALASDYEQIAE